MVNRAEAAILCHPPPLPTPNFDFSNSTRRSKTRRLPLKTTLVFAKRERSGSLDSLISSSSSSAGKPPKKKSTVTTGVIDEFPMPSAAPLASDKVSDLAASEATTKGSTEDEEMLNDSPKASEAEEEAMEEVQISPLSKSKLSNRLNKRSAPLQIPPFVLAKLIPQETATGSTANGTSSGNKAATTANLKTLPTIPKRPPPPVAATPTKVPMERSPPPVAATLPEVQMDAVETPAATGRDPSPAPNATPPPPPPATSGQVQVEPL
jgi:hypothetical protein